MEIDEEQGVERQIKGFERSSEKIRKLGLQIFHKSWGNNVPYLFHDVQCWDIIANLTESHLVIG